MSYGFHLAALYQSGFLLIEDESDRSPYSPGGNVCHAIMSEEPTKHGHGPLLSLSLVPDDGGEPLSVDFAQLRVELGVEARPIYFRRMAKRVSPPGPAVCEMHVFGYQFTDPVTGRNVQRVSELAQ